MSLNRVLIIGRLGQNPELKFTASGVPVCNFSVATFEKWTGKDGQKQEKTEWHKIIAWNKQAELCNQYLTKGSQVYLEGKLETRSWEDKEGTKRFVTEIKLSSVQFLDSKKDGDTSLNQPGRNTGGKPRQYGDTYQDIPPSLQDSFDVFGGASSGQGELPFVSEEIPF